MAPRQLVSKYNGRCACGQSVTEGSTILYESRAIVGCGICHPELATTMMAPPTHTKVRVRVQRVRTATEKFTAIVAFALEAPADWPLVGNFAVIGRFPGPSVDDILDVEGSLENDPSWGWQLRATQVLPALDATDATIGAFLKRFPNVGSQRAEAILRHFGGGEATLQVLEQAPARLAEVTGITPERAVEIGQAFVDARDLRDSMLFLDSLALGEAFKAQILEEFGAQAKALLIEDPYQLMELRGIGFLKADDVAKKLKVVSTDPRRLAAAVLHLIFEKEREGHTWSSAEDLLS